ncbi:hypothetical protein LINPERHAP1_LOCUS30948 [Linum perenne]
MLYSALDMFKEMKVVGLDWSLDTFEELINGMFSRGRIEAGFEILQLMEESKGGSQVARVEAVLTIASLRILGGAVEAANKVYKEMVDEGGMPSAL